VKLTGVVDPKGPSDDTSSVSNAIADDSIARHSMPVSETRD